MTEKKTRTVKAKSAFETELHAARRVGDMLKPLSTEARLRVIKLVHEHLDEAVAATRVEDTRQVPLFGTAKTGNGISHDANGAPC